MKKVEMLGLVSSTQYGNFGPGDILRCSDEFADHLVNEVGCARFCEAETVVVPAAPVEKVVNRKKSVK